MKNFETNFSKWACLSLALAAFSTPVVAGNRTISGAFDGSEATMAAIPDSCDNTPKKFIEAGSIQVDSADIYVFTDIGAFFPSDLPQAEIADVAIMVYQGSFDSNSPLANRVGIINLSEELALAEGTDYVVVVQHQCDEFVGPFGIVVEGPGSISGAGFNSLPWTMGEFSAQSPTAFFGGEVGFEAGYQVTGPVSFPRTGNYYYYDVGPRLNHSFLTVWIYEDSFDPLDTQKNLVEALPLAPVARVRLEAGKSYVFVGINFTEGEGPWQFALFPPGNLGFNPGLNAAWGTPGVEGAGILMEVFEQTGILFFAWFTYTDPLIALQSQLQADEGVTRPQSTLGAPEQIWLTGFGLVPQDGGNFMNVAFENASGGAFNVPSPEPEINSSYGTGWIELFSCSHFDLHFSLPGGLESTVPFNRLVGDGFEYCLEFVTAGAIAPPL